MTDRRIDIVQRLIQHLPTDHQVTVDQAMKTWWYNLRSTGGMRLTKQGQSTLHDLLQLESWQMDLGSTADASDKKIALNKYTVLALDRKLRWPYYLDLDVRSGRRHIVFYSSQEAMMAIMYGNLQHWLESID